MSDDSVRLLVSVRDASEAAAALRGGADIVDAKEPGRGALGPVDAASLRAIIDAVAGERPVSAAAGEAGDMDKRVGELPRAEFEPPGRCEWWDDAETMARLSFVKVGLAGTVSSADPVGAARAPNAAGESGAMGKRVRELTRAAVEPLGGMDVARAADAADEIDVPSAVDAARAPGAMGKRVRELTRAAVEPPGGMHVARPVARLVEQVDASRLVVVAYADHARVHAPPVEQVVALAIEHGAGVLIDTAVKDGAGLFDWLDDASLAGVIARCRVAGVSIALAGSLRGESLLRAAKLRPNIIGIRGAACAAGDRAATIDAARVADVRSGLKRKRVRVRKRGHSSF